MEYDIRLGKNLKAIREHSGMSYGAFAHNIGLQICEVHCIEDATANVSLTTLVKISEGTGCSIDALLKENLYESINSKQRKH